MAMHKLIFHHAAYRHSVKVTPEAFERDPENDSSRAGRASACRPSSSATRRWRERLLGEKLGGPPVKPYQPRHL